VCSALKEEKIAARSAILPMLQAEEDERYVISWLVFSWLYISPAIYIARTVNDACVDL
jgi:hypothetical protein